MQWMHRATALYMRQGSACQLMRRRRVRARRTGFKVLALAFTRRLRQVQVGLHLWLFEGIPVIAVFLANDIALASSSTTSTSSLQASTTSLSTTATSASSTTTPAGCTATAYAQIAPAVAACTAITLQDIHAPTNSSIDLSKLKAGTVVTFAGTTTFDFTNSSTFNPIVIGGKGITVTSAPGAIIDGNGQAYWDGIGSNGGVPKYVFSSQMLFQGVLTFAGPIIS